MNLDHLPLLVCPKSKRQLQVESIEKSVNGRIKTGVLVEPHTGKRYAIVNFIPRFVEESNYADSFGLQWQLHSRTQLDSYSGLN